MKDPIHILMVSSSSARRRLRSDLRTFRSLLDEEWVVGLRDELAEAASVV